MNDALKAIFERSSIRQYRSEQIKDEELDSLVKAALSSPSTRNSQPWHITVVQKREVQNRINEIINPQRDLFYGAPTAIIISYTTDTAENGYFARIDCGILIENIAIAAKSMGLGSVILGMSHQALDDIKRRQIEELLCFDEGYHFAIAIAVGYPENQNQPHTVDENKVTYIR
ncbi:MAG: nitroreductase family protein [Clostridia bacterium]|nr:nitroreductase family protein [Clostridia bacterium]